MSGYFLWNEDTALGDFMMALYLIRREGIAIITFLYKIINLFHSAQERYDNIPPPTHCDKIQP